MEEGAVDNVGVVKVVGGADQMWRGGLDTGLIGTGHISVR